MDSLFAKQLLVLEMLLSNQDKTLTEICDEVEISRRTFFRYIETFRDAGFEILSHNQIFSVGIDSTFIQRLGDTIFFSQEEMQFICSCIMENKKSSYAAHSLKNKLRRTYGIDVEAESLMEQVEENKVAKLADAISRKKMVVLEKYFSPNSQTRTDRLVEPYRIMPQRGEVRCFEVESKKCKTFKVARINKVNILNDDWKFKSEHTHYATDIFGFSGEKEMTVKLRLGFLARRLLMEEYGVTTNYFYQEDEKHWIYSCHVCNFQGIGRFVLGLANDIDVIENEDFKQYLCEKIDEMSKKFK